MNTQLAHSHVLTRFCLLTLMLLLPWAAHAEAVKKIVNIEVSGNRYVERAAILAKIESKTGEILSRKQISRDVRKLFRTGFFEDVHVEGVPEKGGIRLIYIVKENPLIAELKILGNDEIIDTDLRPKLELKPGRVFSAAKLRKDIKTIRKAYLKEGYYQVDVTAENVLREDGRVDLTLHIQEGKITHIKRIHFIGNQSFSDETLRGELASKQSSFLSWFGDKDVFDRERFGADGQLLSQYYMNNGYLDMKIASSQLSLTPDKKSFYLTFSLYEGPQYIIDKIDVQGDMVPSREELLEGVTFEKGDIYSVTELRESITAMEEIVGDEGYAFASVSPLFQRDVEAKKLSITFDIEKGREVYVERIEISGNDKTVDEVVRRELRQHEGERYSAGAVARSKERLQRVRLFKDVRVNLDKTEDGDRVRMNVKVEEDKTGTFSAGAGYSQIEKVFLTAKYEERNFLGKGYTTSLNTEVGGLTQNFNGSFTDPYFLDSDVSATFNLFKAQTRLTDLVFYNQDSYGGGFTFGIPLSEFMSYSVGYQYNRSNLSNIPVTSSLILRSQEGVQTTGEIRNSLYWDTRDRTSAPTKGHIESFAINLAGLGGDNKFYEITASTRSYFSLGNDFVFSPSFGLKTINGFGGEEVPVYRRYSMGGILGGLRGFDSYGVSMRDPATSEIIGGDKELRASLNLFFPLPYMTSSGFRGVLFFDAGTTWGEVNTTVGTVAYNVKEEFSASNIRTSVGFAIEWISPFAPISLAWAIPINKVAGDRVRSFEFALGVGF